jgi:flagellar hook-length control protein FliK
VSAAVSVAPRAAALGDKKSTSLTPAITSPAPATLTTLTTPTAPAFAAQPTLAPTAPSPPAPVTAAPAVTPTTPPTAATPAALAATVTAMHHASQTTAVLQLDPPGLGNLSVHLALGQNGHVNVLFVPSTPQTAQLLNAGMDGLRQAMAATGLTLGQAGVSGGGAQNPGQHGANNQRATTSTPSPVAAVTPAAATPSGVSAYA